MGKTTSPGPAARKSTGTRDLLIGLAAGVLILGFILWGIASMSRSADTSRWLSGVILEKHFTPRPEEQVTIGRGGLHESATEGEYTLTVRAEPGGKVYTVYVGRRDFDAHKPGDPFRFLRPPGEP